MSVYWQAHNRYQVIVWPTAFAKLVYFMQMPSLKDSVFVQVSLRIPVEDV